MIDQESLRQEAFRLLEELQTVELIPLSRTFSNLKNQACLYAVQHRTRGILYLGKSFSIRNRFIAGHKSICWAFLDRLDPDDVGIAIARLRFPWNKLSLELEQILLREVRPPYNSQIAQEA